MHHKSRRQFLTSSAALAAAPLLAGVAGNAIAQAPGRKLGVALCGLGSLSTNQIAPALLKTRNCRLAGIVTGTPAKAEEWKKKYNLPAKSVYDYKTMNRMADNKEIWRARQEFFTGDFPCSTLVQVAGLANPEIKLEITAQAYAGSGVG